MNQTSPRTATNVQLEPMISAKQVTEHLHRLSLPDQVAFWQSRILFLESKKPVDVAGIDYARRRMEAVRGLQTSCMHDCVQRAVRCLKQAENATLTDIKRRELVRDALLSLSYVDHHVLTSAQLQEVRS